MIKYAIKSETGKRDNNQDSVAVIQDRRYNTLAIICDGVGGNKAGDKASQIVVNDMVSSFKQKTFVDPTIEEVKIWLYNSAKTAVSKIMNVTKEHEEWKNMSTTLVAVFMNNDFLVAVSSGDSRAYIQTKSSFMKITRDHNVQNIGSLDLKSKYNGSVLVSAIGDRQDILFDFRVIELEKYKKPRILLTTDGIHDFMPEDTLAKLLKKGKLEDRPANLVKRALEGDSHDNCTCAILEVA